MLYLLNTYFRAYDYMLIYDIISFQKALVTKVFSCGYIDGSGVVDWDLGRGMANLYYRASLYWWDDGYVALYY